MSGWQLLIPATALALWNPLVCCLSGEPGKNQRRSLLWMRRAGPQRSPCPRESCAGWCWSLFLHFPRAPLRYPCSWSCSVLCYLEKKNAIGLAGKAALPKQTNGVQSQVSNHHFFLKNKTKRRFSPLQTTKFDFRHFFTLEMLLDSSC